MWSEFIKKYSMWVTGIKGVAREEDETEQRCDQSIGLSWSLLGEEWWAVLPPPGSRLACPQNNYMEMVFF